MGMPTEPGLARVGGLLEVVPPVSVIPYASEIFPAPRTESNASKVVLESGAAPEIANRKFSKSRVLNAGFASSIS